MSARCLRSFKGRIAPFSFLISFLLFLIPAPRCAAQTTQPFLFAGTYDSSTHSTGVVTFLRNSSTGVLSFVPNSAVTFKDACAPSAIDPTGRFLFGICGDGLSMYTLDPATGIVAETASSPYSVSATPTESGVVVVAETTGQYVYLLKVGFTQSPNPSTFTLDTFQIDPTTPALVPVTSQSLPFNATWVDSAADPNHRGLVVYGNQEQSEGSPIGLLFAIPFDLATGEASIPSAGLTIGNNARSLVISPSGGYLALGWGDTMGSLTVFQISSSGFSMAEVGSATLGLEDGVYGSYTFPDSLFFSPGGNLLYVQAPSPNFSGAGLPYLIFDPSTATPVATPPIALSDAYFLNGLADPQAPFTYVSNSAPNTFGISVYQIDLAAGTASQPAPISSPFLPQTQLTPLLVTVEQGGQGIQGPTLGATPSGLTFTSVTAGQTSNPQNIVLKSLGAQSVSLSTIQISGPNASDFRETDNCIASPVLPTNHTCTISITYAPTALGASQANLFVTDNAAGSPQAIPLSGTAVAPPPAAPNVTLNPASSLSFPGTATQGISTTPQNVTVTNSGDAPLQILSAVLSGFNSSDFSISSDSCSGSIAAKASCTISMVFSPQAAGVRTSTLTITDNAANSPQSLTLTGTAGSAATITTTGSTTATLTAGQTAQFNLQATPGSGFSGTLSFSCSGAPFGANCTVPGTLPISNGTPVSFTVSVSTLGASQVLPVARIPISPVRPVAQWLPFFSLCALALLILFFESKRYTFKLARIAAFSLSILLVFSGIGCGGGSGSVQTPSSPASQTVATPAIQPAAGTYSATQSISITDATAGATVYYTTDGTTPTSASPTYSAPLAVSSATTVQAVATLTGYTNSTVTTAAYKFRTPAATYPINLAITATPSGSGKPLQLTPITLTLVVN